MLTISGGIISGSGDITFANSLEWSSGSLSGSGRKIIAANATANFIAVSYVKDLTGTIDNLGTVNYSGDSFYFSWSSPINSTFNNMAGAVFNVTEIGSSHV